MEYVAFDAAKPRTRRTEPGRIHFPLIGSKDAFETKLTELRRRFPEAVLEAITAMQPFHASPDQMHPLAVLQSLSNGDKHRALQVVKRAQVRIDSIQVSPTPPGEVISMVNEGPIEVDSIVGSVEFPLHPHQARSNVSGTFAWYESVAYEHRSVTRWLRIDEMLNTIGPPWSRPYGLLITPRRGHS